MACRLVLVWVFALIVLAAACLPAERVWWDGSRDDGVEPPGLLLSDNEGYWGECVLTGVEYRYETPPDSPPDRLKDDANTFGRRLLDGRPSGNWWVPVGLTGGRPLVVTFDFKRRCTFAEVDVCTRSKQVGLEVEVSATGQDWQSALSRPREACPEREFHRLPLPARPAGRYLRLTARTPSTTWLDEVLVWGEADPAVPEMVRPIAPPVHLTGAAFPSIPGIDRTAASDQQAWDWLRKLGRAGRTPAVWSQAPTWDTITGGPLLPAADRVRQHVSLSMARNETECLAVALTNTSLEQPRTVTVKLGPFHRVGSKAAAAGLRGEVRVAGAIPSRSYGVTLGPLLAAGNLPGRSLLRRHLTNGEQVGAFPTVTLTPAGSAVLWVSVTSKAVTPGVYEAELAAAPARPLAVRVEVLPVTLPGPFAWWVQTWSGVTGQFPFEYGDRLAREVAYKQSLGITVWNGFPTPGSAAALARERGFALYHLYGLPNRLVNEGYAGKVKPEGLTDADRQAVADHIHDLVSQAAALKLQYDDWFVELWDEPGAGNAAAYGALARLIRQADPVVNIYCNPCFWQGWGQGGVADDRAVSRALGDWYADCVDISCPLYLLLRDRPQAGRLFAAERFVNACYTVASHHAKSEAADNVTLYRRLAWDAFGRGWSGWAFYSYYAPRGNPWDDFDGSWTEDAPDYQVVYPGPRGPIPTRPAESLREGYEDYCLLSLLKELGQERELDAILAAYRAGGDPAQLRLRALRAAAKTGKAG